MTGAVEWIQDICSDTAGALRKVYQQGGPLVAYPNGRDLTLLAFAPEHNRAVLCDPDTYMILGASGPRNSSQRRFALGLFGLNGERHRHHRRLLQPAFRKEIAESYSEPISELVDRHLARWRPGQVRDMAQEMRELAMEVASRLLFGLEQRALARKIAWDMQRWLDAYVAITFATLLPVESRPGSYEGLLEHSARLEQHFRTLLRLRGQTPLDRQNDVLAVLVQARDQGRLTEEEVIGELHTLFNAAYLTTASALTWTLLLLAQHPGTARGVVEELESPSDESGHRPLLERVIKESLRILPPVVGTMRLTRRPARLGSLPIPQGTVVILSFYVTHHMPSLFAEPERFQPDRWQTLVPAPYAYLPYGAGPRMCLGAAFAQQMLRVTVASIVRRFRLTVPAGSRLDRHSSLVLDVQSLPMSIHHQDRQFVRTPVSGNIHQMVDLPQSAPTSKAA